jgi:hypothetical protein
MSARLSIRCECGHVVSGADERELLGKLSDDDLRRMASGG